MRIVTLRNYVEPKLLHTQEQSCNCSLFTMNSKSYLISRCVSYFLAESHCFVEYDKCYTTNYLYEVDDHFNLNKIKELSNPYKSQTDVRYNGLEDIRTVEWNGNIYFICSKVVGNLPIATMCYGMFSKDKEDLGDLHEVKTKNEKEKNWAPIEIEPFACMYAHDPLTKIDLHTHEQQMINGCIAGILNIRGSSSIIRFDENTLISLVHTNDAAHKYTHQLVKFNNQLQVIAISQPFTFFGTRVEFCTTLKVTPNGLLLLPSVNDGLSYVFNVSSELVNQLFNYQLDDDWVDPHLYNKLVLDAISNQAYEVAVTSACMATDKGMIAGAVKYNHEKSPIDSSNRYRRQTILISRFEKIKGNEK